MATWQMGTLYTIQVVTKNRPSPCLIMCFPRVSDYLFLCNCFYEFVHFIYLIFSAAILAIEEISWTFVKSDGGNIYCNQEKLWDCSNKEERNFRFNSALHIFGLFITRWGVVWCEFVQSLVGLGSIFQKQ